VLAHRRLSIIDLACGAQPMVDPSGRVGLSFNGEIYNYVELREQLSAAGFPFTTHSDTEVLLAAFLRDGPRSVNELRGMFALAVWDDAARSLTLVRDRLGKKPLFYVIEEGCLYFSSCLDALRRSAPVAWTINRAALDAYLTLGYVPAPETVYTNARKLEAGTMLTVDRDGRVTIERYWDAAHPFVPFEGSFGDAVDRAHELLVESVRIRLRSDVPLGLFLSGGVDSSLLAAVATRDCGVPLNTFTVGFDVAGHDETEAASAVARHLGTVHREFHAQPELLSILPELMPQFGEPFADPAALPLWVLARETRRHVTVALGGDGGDEGFGGYRWYSSFARLRALRRFAGGTPLATVRSGVSRLLRRALPTSAGSQRMARALDAMAEADPARGYASLRVLFGDADLRAILRDSEGAGGAHALERTATFYRDAGGDRLRRMRCADIGTYLADCLNPKVDVATMAHAMEARAPLLDHMLIEFGLSLPEAYLMDERGGKRVLRAMLARYLPQDLIERPKHGFTVPLDDWFRGAAADVAAHVARSESLAALGHLDMDAVEAMRREHASGRRDHGDRLYGLLALDTWARQL
jgi:asparagine synthase (glutamine-hydrolysing)